MRTFWFILAGSLLAARYLTSAKAEPLSEAKIDQELEESFPSSDAPSWTLGVQREAM